MNLSTTEEYLTWLLRDNGRAELRHQQGGLWHTGWFTDVDAMLRHARERSDVGNLFTSLNAPRPRPVHNAMTGDPLRDGEVAFVTRIPFDLDPVRPVGVSSSEEELRLALERRNGLVRALCARGWPIPLHAKSGNGYHAQYRVRLPANDDTREMLGWLYAGLHDELNDDLVSFDRTVRNPGRIFRLYGSVNRKGPEVFDRVHRKSTVWIPDDWERVPVRLIANLANSFAKRGQVARSQASKSPVEPSAGFGRGDYATLDVVAWFEAHGLYKQHLAGRVHAVTCPWAGEHTSRSGKSDTIIFESDGGWPGFHCHHSHCATRTIRDVMEVLGNADAFCSSEFRGGTTR